MTFKKKIILYFKNLNLKKKNLSLLRNNFQLIELKNIRDLNKKNKLDKEVIGIYCSQKYIYNKFNLSKFNNLKYLLSSTTATTFIDKKYCLDSKIKIFSLEKDTFFLRDITPTAEHVFGLIMMISRNYLQAIDSISRGNFDRTPFGGYKMLSNSTLGIIGNGRLGKIVKKIASGFKMKVLTADIKEKNFKKKLDKIFTCADYVSLHIQHNKNYNFFSQRNIKINKPFYLINTSRGEIVDENFLIKLLKSKKILGYATDVIKGEFDDNFSLKKNRLYKQLKKLNIIITPHIAGSTHDAWYMTQKRVIETFLKECLIK